MENNRAVDLKVSPFCESGSLSIESPSSERRGLFRELRLAVNRLNEQERCILRIAGHVSRRGRHNQSIDTKG
jgi:hypothetical protein